MKKTIKVCLCVITAIMILSYNVFATSWAEENPYFSNYVDIFFPENITSENSTEALTSCMENAYNMGLFGGSVPIACITSENDGYHGIVIFCASTVEYGASGQRLEKAEEYAVITTTNGITNIESSTVPYMDLYALLNNGDILPLTLSVEQYTISTEKLLLTKNQNGEWTYDETSELYAQHYNVDSSENQTLTTLAEKYANANQTTITQVEYILDIPSIITAIPNGAKQIINNAFGFEIFGINVAGLLSVVLIVAIVAFVAKWLMSR